MKNKVTKLTNITKLKLKEISKKERSVFIEDAKDALKANNELNGKIAINNYNKWIRS